ncbi:hypothetical protein PG994_015049 [Apiospora phragmitis]|uniref:AA1-like domain-containing protein n=1 Tax=Apiospora phragmitis TaxID=2905665 RepID=A0ABR1SVC8_9PEZI
MKANSLITIALATAANALAVPRQESGWKVTRFASYVAAHSITQVTSFYVSRTENGTAIACANGSGATLSSTPALTPVEDGKCADSSGLSFSMHQVGEQAVELTVKEIAADGLSGTWTSGSKMIVTMQSPGSNNPNGQITQYVGPTDFELKMQQ